VKAIVKNEEMIMELAREPEEGARWRHWLAVYSKVPNPDKSYIRKY